MQRIPAAQQLLEQANAVKSDTKRDLKVEADNDLMIWEFPTRDRNQNKDLWDNPNWKNQLTMNKHNPTASVGYAIP